MKPEAIKIAEAKGYLSSCDVLYRMDMSKAPNASKLICLNPGNSAVFALLNSGNKKDFIGWAPMPMTDTPVNRVRSLVSKIDSVSSILKPLGLLNQKETELLQSLIEKVLNTPVESFSDDAYNACQNTQKKASSLSF
ncbi:hypothetical protein CL689_06140 [Candidatus Saccharibacteria bacterium]|nr:hypothetical protein [Candidatus Saccharibacteria bacterium]